ncbi:ABC transporter substrate-binding protein [Algoriphagus limi]|uniref:ABC transporter substrate-binding protein n=1 Tax=Algoriphagus limi TaxID=2975273 RepID=A0ABT2G3C5_9BACT|nr:ABC transporter substrate-binding protein [Algoriphagus limi]MCS5489769.1 ABC transporter substrate-binding protein [Algoriphagus limi]
MRKSLFFLPLFFLVSFVFAQSIPDGYRSAKSNLQSGNYWEAMNAFREFTDEASYGDLALYAAFHAGEAAIKANQAQAAIDLLKPLAERSWLHQNESKILLAQAYFLNNNSLEALPVVASIQEQKFESKASNLAYDYLVKESPDFLIRNLKEYQNLPVYTAALSAVLRKKNVLSSDEKSLFYELQGQNQNWSSTGSNNGVFDLVVILPFSNSSQSIATEGFIYELYQGIQLAINQLKKEGMSVSLNTFDSKRSMDAVRAILEEEQVQNADAIIGPIYPEETDLVSSFAEAAKIPFIHPLSNLGDRYVGNSYSYLFRPSSENIAEGIAKGLKSSLAGDRIAIAFGGSSRDTKVAELLKDKLENDGFELVNYQEISPRNAATFLTNLGIRPTLDSVEVLVDQVVVLSDDPNMADPILSLVESVTTSVPIFVMDSWLTFNFANYEMLPYDNFYFISNNTPNFESEKMVQLKDQFYRSYSFFPSTNSILGTELVYWLYSNLNPDLDTDFRTSLDQQVFQAGKLTWGFNFQNSNSNRYVPVFHFVEGELKPINNP